jgi:hypothetical protein
LADDSTLCWLVTPFYVSHFGCLQPKLSPKFDDLPWGAIFFLFFVFQRGFVASVAFVGVWLLWLYHALPIYFSFYLSNLTNLT